MPNASVQSVLAQARGVLELKGPVVPDRCETAAEDWLLLLDAVKQRLAQASSTPPVPSGGRQLLDAEPGLQAIALDCVAALDLLQVALVDDRGLRQRLAFGVREAAASARTRLA